jgi:hypothetical protein
MTMNENRPTHVTDEGALAAGLRARGFAAGETESALVVDASACAPGSWADLERELLDTFRLSRRAMTAGAPIVYVVDGKALYGHADPLAASLAMALLGGARSLAAEGARAGTPVHAVTAGDDTDAVVEAVASLLRGDLPSGQLLHADVTHVGRPAV